MITRKKIWGGPWYATFVFSLGMIAITTIAWAETDGHVLPLHHEADSFPVVGQAAKKAELGNGLAKPFEIPGTGITIQLGGFAKVDYIQDFDPIGNEDQFKVNSIPVRGDPDDKLGGRANISARQTRVSLDVRRQTTVGGFRAYVETDFFGAGTGLRMRHGYGEWAGLLGGQTWSTFQDISARPFTLDYEGPDTEIFVRQPLIRYTGTPWDNFEWAVAVEDPDSQITNSNSVAGSGRNKLPDFVGRIRFKQSLGHLQFGGLVRQLRFVSAGGRIKESTVGYGFNVSGKIAVFEHDAFMGHAGYGSGIGRYIEAFGGTGSDAVLTSSRNLKALDAWAFVLGYQHYWNKQFHSTISGGRAQLTTHSSQPDTAIKAASSAHVNLVYQPFPLVLIGSEVIWGQRKNRNNRKGDAVRLQLSVQYKFR